jgi:tetratricopeptide (TPR) repeat protein
MVEAGDGESSDALLGRVDSALQSLWRGDSGPLEQLLGDDETDDVDLGGLFADAWRDAASGARSAVAISGYEIVERIGRGGMGVVYKAVQLSTKRTVAVKVILGGALASPGALRRFQREVELAARLQHAGLVRILESGETADELPYYAMDYVAGVDLQQWSQRDRPGQAEVLELFVAICEAVHYAHRQGVVHLDLKPSNVLVDGEGQPRVLDFGLARVAGSEQTLASQTGDAVHLKGTLRYMSPEQARGDAITSDPRSDVYALGVILYELLTGQPPYRIGASLPVAVDTICAQPPQRPSSALRPVRGGLETVLLKALAKDPERRYSSVADFSADVQRHVAGEAVAAQPPSRLYRWRKRAAQHRREIRAGIATVAVVLVVIGGWWLAGALAARKAAAAHLNEGRRSTAALLHTIEWSREISTGSPNAGESVPAGLPKAKYRVELHAAAERLVEEYRGLPETVLLQAHSLVQLSAAMQSDSYIAGACGVLQSAAADADAESRWVYGAMLGAIYDMIGDPKAGAVLAQAASEMPDTPQAWYLRSFATLDCARALAYVENGLARSPTGEEELWLLRRRAQLEHVVGQVDAACRDADRLVVLTGDGFGWGVFAADALLRAGRVEEAERRYVALRHDAPAEVKPHQRLALIHLMRRDYERAYEDYREALRAGDDENSWLHYRRAAVAWILGDTDGALADIKQFQLLGGQSFCGEVRRYLMLVDLPRSGRAAPTDRPLESDQRAGDRALDAAETLAKGNALREAIVAWMRDGRVLDGRRLDAALAIAETLEERCELSYYAGEACLQRGDMNHALRCFEQCVETGLWYDPNSLQLDPMTEYHLAKWRLDLLADAEGTLSGGA